MSMVRISRFFAKTTSSMCLFAALSLSACVSSGTLIEEAPLEEVSALATPATETIGTGGHVIGLLVSNQQSNLSDGMPNSAYLAGKLAAQTLKDTQLTLVVHRYENTPESLQAAVTAFNAANVEIIIGPHQASAAAALSHLFGEKIIPILSLDTPSDSELSVYGTGLSLSNETAAVVTEMKRLRYKSIVIARTDDQAATAYAAALQAALAGSEIKVSEIDLSIAANGLAEIRKLAAPIADIPSAIVFATGPLIAGNIIATLRADPLFAKVGMVGNSGWSTSAPRLPEKSSVWYATLKNNKLASFGARFVEANGNLPPTMRGALVYDLVVLAGVLPKIVSDAPYAEDVITNDQGFTGQTGPFRIDSGGQVHRSYEIIQIN